jgi:hypothetical protein
MDDRLNRLVEELKGAIDDSIYASERISGVMAQIEEVGYQVDLLLHATIALTQRCEEPASWWTRMKSRHETRFNLDDLEFLKSMHISVGN